MLDIKLIRSNPEILKKALQKRKDNFDVNGLLSLDEKRRKTLVELEQLRNKQNENSKLIPKYKKKEKIIISDGGNEKSFGKNKSSRCGSQKD